LVSHQEDFGGFGYPQTYKADRVLGKKRIVSIAKPGGSDPGSPKLPIAL
jgi:hypothetical protein